MKLASGVHLTYCTNIYPGEDLASVHRHLGEYVPAVKRRLRCDSGGTDSSLGGMPSRDMPSGGMGVGLRLSAAASEQLEQPGELARLTDLLAEHDLYVFTLNGFPYGTFHAAPVKQQVYLPDWTSPERGAYTRRLARQLSRLLPSDCDGSISTVPGGFREHDTPARRQAIGAEWVSQAAGLWQLGQDTGKRISLAIEPEPACLLETTQEAVEFLERHVFDRDGLRHMQRATGLAGDAAEAALRWHLGICLDTCHAAVEFEDPEQSVRLLHQRGVRVSKLQLSSGLKLAPANSVARSALRRFDDAVYLHQVVVRRGAELIRLLDIPDAMLRAEREPSETEEWRVHFHVPIFLERMQAFVSTQSFLKAVLALQKQAPFTEHLEVETYTWDVLPAEFHHRPLAEAISHELKWALLQLEP